MCWVSQCVCVGGGQPVGFQLCGGWWGGVHHDDTRMFPTKQSKANLHGIAERISRWLHIQYISTFAPSRLKDRSSLIMHMHVFLRRFLVSFSTTGEGMKPYLTSSGRHGASHCVTFIQTLFSAVINRRGRKVKAGPIYATKMLC